MAPSGCSAQRGRRGLSARARCSREDAREFAPRRRARDRDRPLRRGSRGGSAARRPRRRGHQGRAAAAGRDLSAGTPGLLGLQDRFPRRPRLPARQPRQALDHAGPHESRRAQRAAARDRRRRRRDHQPVAGSPRQVRAGSRVAAGAQAEPRDRRDQRLRPRRRGSRPARVRLHRLLGAQRHDGPDARRGRAAVDAASRRRRPRRGVESGDRDPRRAAPARRDGAGPLRRGVAASDGALHPGLRHRDGARRARADQAPRPQAHRECALEQLRGEGRALDHARDDRSDCVLAAPVRSHRATRPR